VVLFGSGVIFSNLTSADAFLQQNCTFHNNTNFGGSGGAAALIGGKSKSQFDQCTFTENSAQSTASSHGLGGAVFVADLSLCTFNKTCRFANNSARPSTRQGSGGTIDPSAGAGGALAVVNSGPYNCKS